ncbi:cytochrome P450 71D8-like [Trifolium pratense]|uniref:cytochrome P450 71D8-like n=1 Tax=Trifolium pratense TaxID=57577 RepID=UPI001E697081|nr:cytochrome P450 71D8-like [Trifolium pratense]XP_045822298.1 cytochrome P450 71D8-like [Trifolium pratense]
MKNDKTLTIQHKEGIKKITIKQTKTPSSSDNAWSICRDSRYWINAEKFYPERFIDSSVDYKGADFQIIPFGAGRRTCPGISFGIANLEISSANLLFHFNWNMPNGYKAEELDMKESFGLTVRRKHDLWLVPTTYQSS